MTTFEQVKEIILEYQQTTADGLGLEYRSVEKFITPTTDLYLLTLISKAHKRGLDLNLVDQKIFTTASHENVLCTMLETGPWPEARYITISLDHLLCKDEHFEYLGHKEGMGRDYYMNTFTLCLRIEEHFQIQNTQDVFFRTINDYIDYINKESVPKEIAIQKEKPWYQRLFN